MSQDTNTSFVSEIASYTHGYVKEYPPCMIKFTGRRKRAKEKKKNQKWWLKGYEQNLACTHLSFDYSNICFAVASWEKR